MFAAQVYPYQVNQPEYCEGDRTETGETAYSIFEFDKDMCGRGIILDVNPRKTWHIKADSRSVFNALSKFDVDTSAIVDSWSAPDSDGLAAFLDGEAVALVAKRTVSVTLEIHGRERGVPTSMVDADYF
jgi:hypothetical protein